MGGRRREAPPPPHVCGGARSAPPLYIFIHISMYFSSLYKLFSLKSAPCGAREAMKWGGLGQPPREYDFRVNVK